jgi:hypothetical protein
MPSTNSPYSARPHLPAKNPAATWLGGRDNLPANRELARGLLGINPGAATGQRPFCRARAPPITPSVATYLRQMEKEKNRDERD